MSHTQSNGVGGDRSTDVEQDPGADAQDLYLLGVQLSQVRETLLGVVNTASELIDRVDEIRASSIDRGDLIVRDAVERFQDEYAVQYERASRGADPQQANAEAVSAALQAVFFTPMGKPDADEDLRDETDGPHSMAQAMQLRSMTEAGWRFTTVDRRDGLLYVMGREPNGDRFRGQIDQQGVFVGEPVDANRTGQRVGIGAPRAAR